MKLPRAPLLVLVCAAGLHTAGGAAVAQSTAGASGRMEAISAFQAGDLARAERLARDWLGAHSQDAEIVRLLGMVRITQGMQLEGADRPRDAYLPVYADALEQLQRAERMEAGRTLPDLDHAVGYILLAQGRFDEARQRLDAAIKLTPERFVLYRLRGSAWMGLGEYERAVADLTESARRQPSDFATHYYLSQSFFLLGKQGEARDVLARYYERIRSEPPDERHWRSLYEVARYSMMMSELEDAREPLEAAVRLRPDALASRVDLGILYYKLSEFDAAAAEIDKVLAASAIPEGILADALHHQGLLARNDERHADAAQLFERVLELQPNRAETLYALSMTLRKLGERERAREVATRFRDVEKLEKAAGVLESQVTLDPLDRDNRVALIESLLQLGRRSDAARHLTELERRWPDDPKLPDLRARLVEGIPPS